MAISNTTATLYHRTSTGFTRVFLSDVWWYVADASEVSSSGIMRSPKLTCRIWDTTVSVCVDDYIVKGAGPASVTTVKDLPHSDDCFRVVASTKLEHGENQHIKLTGGK